MHKTSVRTAERFKIFEMVGIEKQTESRCNNLNGLEKKIKIRYATRKKILIIYLLALNFD